MMLPLRKGGEYFEEAAKGFAQQPAMIWLTMGLLLGQALWEYVAVFTMGVVAGSVMVCCPFLRSSLLRRLAVALGARLFGAMQMQRVMHPVLPRDDIARLTGQSVEIRGELVGRPGSVAAKRTRMLIDVEAVHQGAAEDDWRRAS